MATGPAEPALGSGTASSAAWAVSLADVQAAARRIAPQVHRTRVVTCRSLDELAGRRLFLKCENEQRVGAFKFRGASNAVLSLSDEEAARGVVTHSSGNHAQALALAAQLRGIPAHIVMPRTAPAIKRAATEGYGARVVECEPDQADRERVAARVQAETGAVMIPPYDDPRVIAGQGTVALELLEQVPELDAIIAPVGGGGLLSGVCVASRGLAPAVTIYGAEPAGADDAARSLAAGRRIPQTGPRTIADGLLTSLGELTWPILRDCLRAIPTVDDDRIRAGMQLAFERAKLVLEPSGAVALAAALSCFPRSAEEPRRLGVVLSGGNVEWPGLADAEV